MSDIVQRLRAAHPYSVQRLSGSDILKEAADKIERLQAALETSQSWVDRWTEHVGDCKGGDRCTCGRTVVLYEASAALNNQQSTKQEG